jgi:hypothetical protein
MEDTFNLLVDLGGLSPTCEVHTYKNGIQVPLYLANILSLLHLQCKENKRKWTINRLQPITHNHIY